MRGKIFREYEFRALKNKRINTKMNEFTVWQAPKFFFF